MLSQRILNIFRPTFTTKTTSGPYKFQNNTTAGPHTLTGRNGLSNITAGPPHTSSIGSGVSGTTLIPNSLQPMSIGWPAYMSPNWPFGYSLDTQEQALYFDFKLRHPDFDALGDEIRLILKYKPGLANTVLFISLIYELAVALKQTIDHGISQETTEALLDGKTEEATG